MTQPHKLAKPPLLIPLVYRQLLKPWHEHLVKKEALEHRNRLFATLTSLTLLTTIMATKTLEARFEHLSVKDENDSSGNGSYSLKQKVLIERM